MVRSSLFLFRKVENKQTNNENMKKLKIFILLGTFSFLGGLVLINLTVGKPALAISNPFQQLDYSVISNTVPYGEPVCQTLGNGNGETISSIDLYLMPEGS